MANQKPSWGNAPQESTTAGSGGWGNAPQESTTAGSGGWGNAPQESTTAKTGGWGDAPQESTTAKTGGWGNTPQESTTGGQPKQSPGKKGDCPVYSFYILNGLTFSVKRVISDQSGEAIIFEVENSGNLYALKLYRRGVVPNHDVLQRIMEQRGNGLLVDIYAHGQWHDDVGGGDYHYEVMEHCCGGSLANVNVHGDEEKLRMLAARMASAIDFAHSKGVLHRDVKPANFLFVDKEQTRFVLTDWGLAKMLDKDRRTVTDAGRTKIYAAPEMYTYIPGTPTYVGPKADFFSMGMTLMALWMGEGRLLADETKLVHDKQEETLPYPQRGEMSDHMLGLIKAMTRRNPDVRAGFDEMIRWSKGESIFQEKEDDSLAEFKIVFNATAGLIAHTPKELSDMMWADQELAKKYLYSDKVTKWFRDIERPELAMAMEDITENRFPGNRDEGLYAACLTLNPEMPYTFIQNEKRIEIHNLKELGEALGNYTISDISGLTSQAFLMWVATKDPALAGKAMKRPNDWWYIAYTLTPDRSFYFSPLATSDYGSAQQLGQRIVDEISGVKKAGPLLDSVAPGFDKSRLYAYLSAKEQYDSQIKWIKYCLELNSQDNKKKFAPYTLRVARFKAATGLLGKVPPITLEGHTFEKPKDIEQTDMSAISPDSQDILADWLALFYQEDPNADYKKKSYLKRTSEYSDALDSLPECSYCQQSEDSAADIAVAMQVNEQSWRKVKIWRWIAGIFGFLPLLIMCAAGIYLTVTMGALDFSDSLEAVGYWVGIGVGGLIFLGMLGEDYGFIFAGIAAVICFALIRLAFTFLGFIVPWLVIGLMLVALIFLGKKVFWGEKQYFDDQYSDLDWDEVVERYFVGIRFDCLDKVFPLNVPDDYPVCVIDECSERAYAELPGVRKSALLMLAMALIGGALCWFTAKGINAPVKEVTTGIELLQGNFRGDIEGTPATIDFKALKDGELEAVMSIDYRSGNTRQTMAGKAAVSFPVILPKTDDNSIYLQIDTAYTQDATTIARGIYCNSKKKLRKVNIQKK